MVVYGATCLSLFRSAMSTVERKTELRKDIDRAEEQLTQTKEELKNAETEKNATSEDKEMLETQAQMDNFHMSLHLEQDLQEVNFRKAVAELQLRLE